MTHTTGAMRTQTQPSRMTLPTQLSRVNDKRSSLYPLFGAICQNTFAKFNYAPMHNRYDALSADL